MCYVRVWIQKLYHVEYFYFYTANFRGYLICSAMEQELRWDTRDFLAESSYHEGNLTNLRPLHPLNILIGLMCELLVPSSVSA